jgi:hypothetical protein
MHGTSVIRLAVCNTLEILAKSFDLTISELMQEV